MWILNSSLGTGASKYKLYSLSNTAYYCDKYAFVADIFCPIHNFLFYHFGVYYIEPTNWYMKFAKLMLLWKSIVNLAPPNSTYLVAVLDSS